MNIKNLLFLIGFFITNTLFFILDGGLSHGLASRLFNMILAVFMIQISPYLDWSSSREDHTPETQPKDPKHTSDNGHSFQPKITNYIKKS